MPLASTRPILPLLGLVRRMPLRRLGTGEVVWEADGGRGVAELVEHCGEDRLVRLRCTMEDGAVVPIHWHACIEVLRVQGGELLLEWSPRDSDEDRKQLLRRGDSIELDRFTAHTGTYRGRSRVDVEWLPAFDGDPPGIGVRWTR